MMKKQILSLVLSAAIFTTSPLFAMDEINDDSGTASPFQCPSCIIFEVTEDEENAGKGSLRILPLEKLQEIVELLTLNEQFDLSHTSKSMHGLFQEYFWTIIGGTYSDLTLSANQCVKCKLSHELLDPFKNWEAVEVTVTPSQLKDFTKMPCETTWWPHWYVLDNPGYPYPQEKTYSFSRGPNNYEMYVCDNNGLNELLQKNEKTQFSWSKGRVNTRDTVDHTRRRFVGNKTTLYIIKLKEEEVKAKRLELDKRD